MDDLIAAKRRERLGKVALVVALVVLAVGLIGSFALQWADRESDRIQREATKAAADNLADLCRDGAINCEGTNGLPGPKGVPGIGIADIRCTHGRFVFVYTNGSRKELGDCIAEKGDRGHVGPRGPRGFTGPQGHVGPRGPKGHRGARGLRGKLLLGGGKARLVWIDVLP